MKSDCRPRQDGPLHTHYRVGYNHKPIYLFEERHADLVEAVFNRETSTAETLIHLTTSVRRGVEMEEKGGRGEGTEQRRE